MDVDVMIKTNDWRFIQAKLRFVREIQGDAALRVDVRRPHPDFRLNPSDRELRKTRR